MYYIFNDYCNTYKFTLLIQQYNDNNIIFFIAIENINIIIVNEQIIRHVIFFIKKILNRDEFFFHDIYPIDRINTKI